MTTPEEDKTSCQARLVGILSAIGTFKKCRDAWVAQLVKHLTLDFGSGHDLRVHEIEPHIRLCTDSTEPAWDSLSLSLCPSPAYSLSLSQNK